MVLFRRRPPRQEYAVSVEALWGALKAALPSVTSQATFYEDAHKVEWTTDVKEGRRSLAGCGLGRGRPVRRGGDQADR